ncbi:pilin [Minisyncoccus archaeiphilus]|uniref:pilin n=1 Tax=Minisyncoccus archaeiphilus TaxID=3238481 RepID=UPI00399CAF09
MKKNSKILSLIFVLSLSWVNVIFAADQMADVYELVEKYYKDLVMIGSGIGLIMVIYGGFKIFFSGGSPAKTGEGKKIIIGAFFGLLILVGSYVVVYVINPAILDPEEPEIPVVGGGELYGVYLTEPITDKELHLKGSVTSLGNLGMDQKVDKYHFVQPENSDEKFAAIFFSDADYKGECFYGGNDGTGGGAVPFKPGSVFIFKTKGASGAPVYVYNNDNGECVDLPKIGGSIYPEKIEVTAYGEPFKLFNKDHWIESPAIKIDSKEVLVLLMTRNMEECGENRPEGESEEGEVPKCFHCQLIRKVSDSENCFPVKYDHVYHRDAIDTMKPGFIKLFHRVPTDNLY